MTAQVAPKEFYTAEEVSHLVGALTRANDTLRNIELEKAAKSAERVKEAALGDQRRELFSGARANYEAGRFELGRLKADEYRDTYVTLAEIRTRTFAAQLTYSDPDGAWTVTALVSRHADLPARRLEKELLTQQAAWDFYNRVVERFYATQGFVCRVDY